jgi:alpha-1,3-glucan synthase
LYTLFLAIGQIMAANSYQITLLSGPYGQNAEKFFFIAGIYLTASVLWWFFYRWFKPVYVLSLPFVLYGFSFLVLGIVPFLKDSSVVIEWTQNAATGMYTTASASGSLYFALNFGDEGGSPIRSWVYRACIIQGTQQIYVCALWFWGSHFTTSSPGQYIGTVDPFSKTMAAILLPVALLLFFIGYLVHVGLPDYYHQVPGKVPSFYMSLLRRKIVVWFFITVIIQNFFLSTISGRNWSYLWSSNHATTYQIVILTIFFFVILWATFLWCFGLLSTSHPWILPIFAIGLGAPRWAQILWSCSNIGLYLPWAGSSLASTLLGRSLWLWLGVLDALQGVGFGMILLQTLTRIHISFTLIGAQVIGSIITMLARAVGPDKVGPGGVFPDFSGGVVIGLVQPWFWLGLFLQLCICAGFFAFFRKEQLSKP